MTDREIAYLAVLVRRDGDERLQHFYNIDKVSLYNGLVKILNMSSNIPSEAEFRIPVMQTLSVTRTKSNLNYD